MNKLYYVDPNGVLTEYRPFDGISESEHYTLVYAGEGILKLPKLGIHATKQSALEAQRAIFKKEAKTELQNIFLANARHGKLMQRLVDIDIELYDLRKGEGLPPITDTQVKL